MMKENGSRIVGREQCMVGPARDHGTCTWCFFSSAWWVRLTTMVLMVRNDNSSWVVSSEQWTEIFLACNHGTCTWCFFPYSLKW